MKTDHLRALCFFEVAVYGIPNLLVELLHGIGFRKDGRTEHARRPAALGGFLDHEDDLVHRMKKAYHVGIEQRPKCDRSEKTEASRPRNGGFRAQCEFMAWATRGPFPETGVYLDGCFRVLADRDKLHQAVKPLALMKRLGAIAPAGGLVVDPFVGSGSTCIAALRSGRRVIGVEINAQWAALARERVRADIDSTNLTARAAGQLPMFRKGT